jgi:sulfatase modifying factor 1
MRCGIMKKMLSVFVFAVVLAFLTAGCAKNNYIAPNSSELVTVPGGTFTQTDGAASFSHTISPFKIGKYEVTYELWYTVYRWAAANGYSIADPGTEGNNGTPGAVTTTAKYVPVTSVNWHDMIVWCNAFSEKSGLKPVYYTDPGFKMPLKDSHCVVKGKTSNTKAGNCDNPCVNWNANGYRLPTEGEWQYAASYKDGTHWTPYNYASGAIADQSINPANEAVAWYERNSHSAAHNVGTKKANALGIFDMSGNVWELCWDLYGKYPGTVKDYKGPAGGTDRVIRSGCYGGTANYLQVGFRSNFSPDKADSAVGFRFAAADLGKQ